MDKWLSGEGSFKRTPTQGENGTSVEETKKIYESSSLDELRNRLAGQAAKKENKRRGLRNSLLLLAVLTSVLAVATVLLLARVGVLQSQNNSLGKEVETLKSSIAVLENESKEIQSRLSMAEKEKRDLKDRIENISRDKMKLEEQLRSNQTLIGNANEEKTYLEEILINKTKEIEQLKKGAPVAAVAPVISTAPASSGDVQKLAQQLRDKDAEIQRLNEQNKILSNRIEKLYKVTNDKIAAINVAKMALEETISEARENIDTEWSTVDLGSIQAGQKAGATAAAPAKAASNTSNTSKKEGHVLAVNDQHGFVVVDLGKAHGIQPNTVLTLKQNGQEIGTLTVLEVRDVMTACNIKELKAGKKIAINDLVSVQR